jgi:hypothetical protein
VATEDELIAASVGLAASVLSLILVPAAGRDLVPARKPKPNDPGLNDPAFGVLVTVTSVPTPFTGGTITRVAVDVSGEPYLDLEREAAAMLARE